MAEISVIDRDERRQERGLGNVAYWLAAGAALLALVAPALWNGFPLIFPDTGGYLQRPITGTLELGRSALYGVFLIPGAPLAFWPNIVVQSGLVVWLIALTLRVHKIGGRAWLLLGIVAILAVITSLPWFVSQMMPDILFPVGVLALYLLVFGGDDIRTIERIGLGATIAFAICSHMAFMGVALGLVAALLIAGLLKNFPRPRFVAAGIALAGGLLLAPVSNLAVTGHFAFTPGGISFLFNRLVEDGIVSRYLDDVCPDPTLRICPYRTQIAGYGYDDWLWRNSTPFTKLGRWKDYSSEERRIVLATLARYPAEQIENAVAHSAEQFVSFATAITADNDRNFHVIWTFKDYLPALYPALMEARQQNGGFDVKPLNWIHIPAGSLAMLGLAAVLLWRRRLDLPPQAAALAATVLLALIVNGAVCGVFSHASNRYQSRLMPLAPLAMMIVLVGRRRVC